MFFSSSSSLYPFGGFCLLACFVQYRFATVSFIIMSIWEIAAEPTQILHNIQHALYVIFCLFNNTSSFDGFISSHPYTNALEIGKRRIFRVCIYMPVHKRLTSFDARFYTHSLLPNNVHNVQKKRYNNRSCMVCKYVCVLNIAARHSRLEITVQTETKRKINKQ